MSELSAGLGSSDASSGLTFVGPGFVGRGFNGRGFDGSGFDDN
jgi:hypothetical protein